MRKFETPHISTLKVKVDLNENGFIAQEGDTKDSSKTLSIKGFKINDGAEESNVIFQHILGGIGGISYDTSTTKKVVTYKVDKPQYSEVYHEVDFVESDVTPIFAGTYTRANTWDWSAINEIFSGTYVASSENNFAYSDFDTIFS